MKKEEIEKQEQSKEEADHAKTGNPDEPKIEDANLQGEPNI